MNKTYGTRFLIGEYSVKALKHPGRIQLRVADKVILKGRTTPVYLYEMIDWEDQLLDVSLKAYLREYELAFKAYEQGNFEKSVKLLLVCKKHYTKDPMTTLLMSRCDEFIKNGVSETWDGSYSLASK